MKNKCTAAVIAGLNGVKDQNSVPVDRELNILKKAGDNSDGKRKIRSTDNGDCEAIL